MRCSICDYSDETPSILNDGLTDGNSPRSFVRRKGEVFCAPCNEHLHEVKRDWDMQEHDEEGKSSPFCIDVDWDKL